LPAGAEAWSLFGEPLVPPAPGAEALETLQANLAEARAALEKRPDDADAIIWLGRRLAYLGRYREAIDVFGKGAARFPGDARFLRHRGHRYLTTRRFDLAVADFSRAADLVKGRPDEVEPDGQPNARNTPTSTLQFNIYYHLGLAHYARGEFDRALAAYRSCLDVSKNPDALVATSHWLYMTLRRLGREADARQVLAPISARMDIIENRTYHDLLLVYRGDKDADALLSSAQAGLDRATVGYGVGNWHFYHGRRDRAVDVWRGVLAGPQWASFGAIAAEADLHRLGETPSPQAAGSGR
jgi:tetratricopeptide (TPR) repeat protein